MAGLFGRMSCEKDPGVVPLQLFPTGFVPKQSVHDAVARAMSAKWPDAFAAQFRALIEAHVATAHGVRDAIARHGLSEEEARAIAYYCSDARMVAGGSREMSVFFALNMILATRQFYVFDAWRNFVAVLLSGLRKLPPYAGEVYRALDRPLTQLSRQYQAGNKVCWVAFTSCSKNKDCLKQFAGRVGEGTWISLKVRSARDVSELSLLPEDEVLLLPNTVVDVEEVVSSPEMKAMLEIPANLDLICVVEPPPPGQEDPTPEPRPPSSPKPVPKTDPQPRPSSPKPAPRKPASKVPAALMVLAIVVGVVAVAAFFKPQVHETVLKPSVVADTESIRIAAESLKQASAPAESISSLKSLNKLLISDENKGVFVRSGGISSILRALKLYVTDADVCIEACNALNTLASHSVDSKVAIAHEGGINTLIAALSTHPGIAEVRNAACDVLKSLSAFNAKNILEIERAFRANPALNQYRSKIFGDSHHHNHKPVHKN